MRFPDGALQSVVKFVMQGPTPAPTIQTAFGPIKADFNAVVEKVAAIGIAFGGIAAIGLIAAGAFTILTSSGDPEKLINGREMITNALMGLALIVLALVVLRWLGVDILGISELGSVTGT